MWLLYQILMAAALVLAAPWVLARRGRLALEVARRRLLGDGADGGGQPRSLWVHAVSVGEVGVADTLIRALPVDLPVVLTTVTPTGQELARRRCGERARVTYLPFDLRRPMESFLERFEPRGLVAVEGDLWPLALRLAKRRRLPVVVVNGRVGDRSFRRMSRLKPLLGPLLKPVDHFATQSDRDRQRLEELGVHPARITVTGNLKFDTPEPPRLEGLERAIRDLAAGRPVLLAGSTMDGEEELVLRAFRDAGGGEAALLILAPRHPERFEEVARLIESSGLSLARRSTDVAAELVSAAIVNRGEPTAETSSAATRIVEEGPHVLLLDSLGELASLYRVAHAAFIGGTLVPTGGHNPLEAMRFGVPVAAGPSMFNFHAIAETLDNEACWQRVPDAATLAATWREWLRAPDLARKLGERGRNLVRRSQGALERTVAVLSPLLEEPREPRAGAANSEGARP
ncbi:MAG: 3-deoxy-D-manno-octulosonic acid transferase [Thermoanaerobaculia bacterium]